MHSKKSFKRYYSDSNSATQSADGGTTGSSSAYTGQDESGTTGESNNSANDRKSSNGSSAGSTKETPNISSNKSNRSETKRNVPFSGRILSKTPTSNNNNAGDKDGPAQNDCCTAAAVHTMYDTPPVVANLPDITTDCCSSDCNNCFDYYYNQGYVSGYNESNKRNREYVQQTNGYSYKFGYNNGWNESNKENREFVDKSSEWYYETGYNKGFNDSNDENSKFTEQSNEYYYEAGYNSGWNDSNDSNECYVRQSNDYYYELGYNTGTNDANKADDEYIEKLSRYYYEYGFNDGFDNCSTQKNCCPNTACCLNNSCCSASCGNSCAPCRPPCCNCCPPEPCKIYCNLETKRIRVCSNSCSSSKDYGDSDDCEDTDRLNNNNRKKIKTKEPMKDSRECEEGDTVCIPLCCGGSNTRIRILTSKKSSTSCAESEDSENCDDCCPSGCYYNPCCYPNCCWSCAPASHRVQAVNNDKQTQSLDDKCCQAALDSYSPAICTEYTGEDGDTEDFAPPQTGQPPSNSLPAPQSTEKDDTFKCFVPYNNMFNNFGGSDFNALGLGYTTTIQRTVKHVVQGEEKSSSKPDDVNAKMRTNHELKKRRISEIEEQIRCLCNVIRQAERDLRDAECEIASARRKICRGAMELNATIEHATNNATAVKDYDEDDDECEDHAGTDGMTKSRVTLPQTNAKIQAGQAALEKWEMKYRDACKSRRKALRLKEKLEDELNELRPRRPCVVYAEYIEQCGRRFKVIY